MPDAAADNALQPTRLADYRPPAFLVGAVDLAFDLAEADTRVAARLTVRRNPAASDAAAPLHLDGDELELIAISLDGRPLAPGDYRIAADGALILDGVPDAFTLDIATRIVPELNTALSGLYISGGNFCTQCEPEGFRRITYFPDRPDVMARYAVTVRADKARFPVLLSNGNPAGQGDLPDGRHWAKWVDPHPKPSYLFALVAGDLVPVEDRFRTRSGREVGLAIWVRRGDEDKCGHAMASLKKAMRWDEEVFGLEYDLEIFNIVAVSDFNMGAMENKGLNIFNTRYVLAKPETATDGDYQAIEAVIAHEYFHNWTGNRVTCRDWFQLSLKEGLTVFRDQLFSADQGSPAVCRIGNIRGLRAAQFPEDAGPLAHPVQPQSYLRIDNFYTATVYNKGAEVIRMIHTLLGPEGFRRGMDLYIAKNDNHAATIGDFVAAMEEGGGVDLSEFALWYRQAGTPEITVEDRYDAVARTYELDVAQRVPPTPGQPDKQPMLIPLAIGLLGPNGDELPTRLEGETASHAGTRVLVADRERQVFRFADVAGRPVPSLLRDFSAPVKLQGTPLARLKFLAFHDSDPVARWDAGQQAAIRMLLDRIEALQQGGAGTGQRASGPHADGTGALRRAMPPLDPDIVAAMRHTLADAGRDPAFAAEALALPSETTLAEEMPVVAVEAIHAARESAERPRRARPRARRAARRRLSRPRRPRALPQRRTRDRPAGVAQCLPRLSRRRRSGGRCPPRQGAVRSRRQHDRRAGGARGADRHRLPGACRGARRLLPALGGRPVGHRQMVCPAGPLGAPRYDRRGSRADGPPGLHPRQPEPRARRGWHLLAGQPAAFPRGERRGLRVSGRRGAGARPRQPDDGGAAGAAIGAMAALRRGPPGADAGRARPNPRFPRPQRQHPRNGREKPRPAGLKYRFIRFRESSLK
jgi:aminopeptidase N